MNFFICDCTARGSVVEIFEGVGWVSSMLFESSISELLVCLKELDFLRVCELLVSISIDNTRICYVYFCAEAAVNKIMALNYLY